MSRPAWAKCAPDGGRHALTAHSLDVSAVFACLLSTPFAGLLGGLAGDARQRARLAVLAALHDAGKVHPAFQRRAIDPSGPRVSHCEAGFGLCRRALRGGRGEFAALLRTVAGWFDPLEDLLRAVFAHHGRPVAWRDPTDAELATPGYDAWAEADRLARSIKDAWPEAFAECPGRTELTNPEVHALAGLLALADWIGSDRDFFPFDPDPDAAYARRAAQCAARAVAALALTLPPVGADEAAAAVLGGRRPRAAQRAMPGIDPAARLVVLEAETGAGKTEAALLRFAVLAAAGRLHGLYFALPTRAAARQIHGRVAAAARRLFGPAAPDVVLAIPGQRVAGDATGRMLPDFRVLWDDSPLRVHARWAAEQATRFLAAPIAVGTIDQALMAALQVKHAPMRATVLQRSLLVVDEVHASDGYMIALLEALLRDHLAAGGHALLMSATLGAAARARLAGAALPALAAARALPYPAIWTGETCHPVAAEGHARAVEMEARSGMNGAVAAEAAIAAADAGARVLVIRNSVSAAVATFDAVLAQGGERFLLTAEGRPTLHHARFAAEDRARLDTAVGTLLAPAPGRPRRGAIVIGTQTLEQSLDIDADLLITDLCPVDVLLQRIGRLHRHHLPRPEGFGTPRCLVLEPEEGLDPLAAPAFRNGLGLWEDRGGIGGIYMDLPALALTAEALRRHPVWEIPAMNRALVEGCTHPEARAEVIARRGWEGYERRLKGLAAAQGMIAGMHLLCRSEPLPARFLSEDEAVMTRLGEMGPEIALPEGTVGPFGTQIARIVLPAHWARGRDVPDRIAAVDRDGEGAIRFELAGAGFRYDCRGLARMRTPQEDRMP